jgi:hypothetical protein
VRKRTVGRSSRPILTIRAYSRSRDGDWSEADVITRISESLRALTEADVAQSIIVVDRDRVRRRRLPIEK